MNFERDFPLKYYLNLGRREDRRTEIEWMFDEVGITVERFPAVDARFVRNLRGYEEKGRYALALTIRLAIRRAKQKGAKSVLLFEDDAVLHPNFVELVNQIELPEDWGIFYFGCQHCERPEPFSPGLVRVTRALDAHAWAIHESAYDEVMRAIDAIRHPSPDHPLASDQFVVPLQERIPTYACFPNLAWQSHDPSDLTGTEYSFYDKGGTQIISPHVLEGMMTECNAPEVMQQPPKLGLLFLTRGDVNHPEIWREWIAQAPDQVRMFTHAKRLEDLQGGLLEGTQIEAQIDTAWGEVSLVRASLALLRAALEDETITHFALVSESCVPVQPLTRILKNLTHDPRCQFGFRDVEKASAKSKHRFRKTANIPEGCWRFHQQWWLLNRVAARLATRIDKTGGFEEVFASDEGYFGTVLVMAGYPVDDLVYNKDVTWTHWPEKGAGSPAAHETLAGEQLVSILRSGAIFARKFPGGADVGRYRLHLE